MGRMGGGSDFKFKKSEYYDSIKKPNNKLSISDKKTE